MIPVDQANLDRSVSASAHPPRSETGQDDPRIAAALEEYLEQLKAGTRPSREDFLARHAEIAERLSECLDGLEFVQSATNDLPGPDPFPSFGAAFSPTRLLGDYQIVREIGRGGMGVVYEAEQVSLRRLVALKVLPSVASVDPRQLQRFQVEAQVAAHLHHPHIVPVFAVGCDQGIHYYAMQYIEGRPLAALIRDLRQPAEKHGGKPAPGPQVGPSDFPTVKLSDTPSQVPSETPAPSSETDPGSEPSHRRRTFFRMAAELGRQAAEALEHAHGLGVLHRDIKPSNLIIDARGDIWVTDFGLARFQDDEGLTRTGDLVGTLRYMSPEQARGRRVVVDHRSDIYSLGATLYEMVTLRPAFDGRDRQEILYQITFSEPTPPRRFNPSIPRDLETIILKAMSKEVGARYASARAMADDLARFLQSLPIQARRPTPFDIAVKWSRRHKTALAAATSVLVLGLLIGFAMLWVEKQRTLKALVELRQTQQAERKALAELRQARQAERAAINLIFSSSDEITMESMANLAATAPDKGRKAGGYYRRALSYYEDMTRRFRNDPEMSMITAESYRRVGFIQMILRYYHKEKDYQQADAEGAYRKAITVCDETSARTPDQLEPRQLKAAILDELGQMLMVIKGIEAGEACFRAAIGVRSRLAAETPDNSKIVDELKQSLKFWSNLLGSLNRLPEAAQALREALKLDHKDPSLYNALAWLLAVHADLPANGPEEAETLAQQAVKLGTTNAAYWNTLGLARFRAGHLQEARSAVDNAMKLHAPDATDWYVMALIQERMGEHPEARQSYENARAWMRKHKNVEPALLALQKEADSLLNVEKPPTAREDR